MIGNTKLCRKSETAINRSSVKRCFEGKTKWPRCYVIITDNHRKVVKKNTEHNYLINLYKKKTYILGMSSIRLLPGNNTSKSTSWVTVWTLPVSNTFNSIDPFDIQNAWLFDYDAVFYTSPRVSYSMYKDYH